MPTDKDVQNLHKEWDKEQPQPQHKKHKDEKIANIVRLVEEDMRLLFEVISKVVQSSLKFIGRK